MSRTVCIISMLVLPLAWLFADNSGTAAVHGMSLNGATGIIVVPDARIAREDVKTGINTGYSTIWTETNRMDHLPRVTVSLYRRFELSAMAQIKDAVDNVVFTGKAQLREKDGAALALGADFELYNAFTDRNSAKAYLAATYSGNFFNRPAVTTANIGWQFLESGDFGSQFVYGMGFSLGMFSKTFGSTLYWITDFANFSYVLNGAQIDAAGRGTFNTGLRIHAVKKTNFNMFIDLIGTDLLDDGGRGIAVLLNAGFGLQ